MPARFARTVSLFWTLQLVGWLAFGVAMTFSRMGVYPLDFMVVAKGVLAVLGFAVTLVLRVPYRRLVHRGAGPARLLVASVAGSYVASLVWMAGYNVFFEWYAAAYFGEAPDPMSIGRLFNGSVYHAFALLAWSVLYFGIKYYQALQTERERTLRAEAQAQAAQLRALRYQLNPHFLFNTLNAVSTLVVEQRTREAAGMIARLSDFLRLTLDSTGAPEIPLAEEIDLVRRYLEVEQIRFGERLRVRIDVDDEALALPVPALILQPLVENAIKHAVSPREEGGRIRVEGRRSASVLRLRVTDDGPGLAAVPEPALRGIGLANTSERLRQLYGGRSRLELGEAEGGGLRITLSIPLPPALAPAVAVGAVAR